MWGGGTYPLGMSMKSCSITYDTCCKQNPRQKKKKKKKPPTYPNNKTPKQPMWAGKISVFHQVKGKNTLARNQRQGFGSQPKQELKSKTIFACAQLRLLRQKRRRGGVGGMRRGLRGRGQRGRGQEKKCIFHQPVYNL